MKTFLEFAFIVGAIASASWVHPGFGVFTACVFGVAVINALDGES